MVDDMMDLAITVIILAVVVGIAMGLIVPLVQVSEVDYNESIYNKTVSKAEGESVVSYGDYDGKMSKLESALAIEVMDWGCPDPRKIKVGSSEINITSTYKDDLEYYSNILWSQIGLDPSNTRYRYNYEFGDPDNKNDDYYILQK